MAKKTNVLLKEDLEKYKIHNFIRKILQKDVFDKLIEYINFRVKAGNDNCVAPRLTAPVSINLDLVAACNYYCDHCIDLEIIENGGMLKFKNIENLINRWSNEGLKSVIIIGGGEPTLHPDFEKVVEFIKSKNLDLGISSNGSKMSRIAKIAHLLNNRDWVRLSLDAGTDEIFKKIHNPRVEINLDDILSEVKELREKSKGFQMGFSFLVISDEHVANNKRLVSNIGEINLAVEKAKKSGFSYFSIKPFIFPSGLRPTRFKQKSIIKVLKEMESARKFEDKRFKIIENPNFISLFKKTDNLLKDKPKTCHAQFFRYVVCPEGIYNCTLWRGFDMSQVIDMQRDIDEQFFNDFHGRLFKLIENFDAKQTCKEVSCIYNDFNCFIEDLIKNPSKVKSLEKADNFYDYFL